MKYFVALLLVLWQPALSAQETILMLDAGPKRIYSIIDKADGSNEFIIALAEENRVNFYLFDNNWKSIGQFNEKREWVAEQSVYEDYKRFSAKPNVYFSKGFESLGTISKASKQLITSFRRNQNVYFQQIDFTANKTTNLDLWKAPSKERILHTFNLNNKIYWITYGGKKDDDINLYSFDNNQEIEEKTFSIKGLRRPGVYRGENRSAIGSEFIDNDKQTDLLESSARLKFYAQKNTLYIVSDDWMGKTIIEQIDLNNFQQTTTIIEQKPNGNPGKPISHQNSFLLNDHLLQVNVCNGTFTFRILNLNTKKEAIYSFDKSMEIEFRNTDVMQYGQGLFSAEEKKLNKPSQFLRKVDSEALSVMAQANDNGIEVTMGSSQLVRTRGGMTHVPGAVSTPGEVASGSWISTGFYDSETKTIFFKGLFDKNNYQHIKGELSLHDKMKQVDDFYDRRKESAVNPLIIDETIFSAYYDKDSKKFILVRF